MRREAGREEEESNGCIYKLIQLIAPFLPGNKRNSMQALLLSRHNKGGKAAQLLLCQQGPLDESPGSRAQLTKGKEAKE